MKSARSYPLDSSFLRPEKVRARNQRPTRKRIRNSASAGPTIATLHRSNRMYRTATIANQDEDQQIYQPCSVSADVSSTSSSATDYEEKRSSKEVMVCNPLEKIMHVKHKVIRRAREQIIKLVDIEHPTASQNDTASSRMLPTNFLPIPVEDQSYLSTKTLASSTVDFDHLEREGSMCKKIHRVDDTLGRFDKGESLVRDRDKHDFGGKILATDARPERYTEDGRSLGTRIELHSPYEYSPRQFERDRFSPDMVNYLVTNRKFTRKMNKFFVPFTNEHKKDDADLLQTTFGDTEQYVRRLASPNSDEKMPGIGVKLEQQHGTTNDLGSLIPTHELQQTLSPTAGHSMKSSMIANEQHSVKTVYENPVLKHPLDSCLSPTVTESKLVNTLSTRSTNTSPVLRQTRSTDTTFFRDSVRLMSQKAVEVEGKDASKASQNFPNPFYVIQPLLFVLAMFTVSMSGAYVGVMVASAACSTGSNMECEPSILQWLFSSRRHIRAF